MQNQFAIYNWFQKIINFCICVFFVFAIISNLYVYTYALNDNTKAIAFIILITVYLLVLFFFKKRIKNFIAKTLSIISNIDEKKMIIIVSLIMILLKVIFTLLFYFDPTLGDGDIAIYSNIANNIANGNVDRNEISHLLGIGYHLATFKRIGIPYHIGLFIVLYIGTIINFFSFKSIIGKSKAFLCILAYIIMPSTVLLSFCPTHEVFVYCYFSLLIFLINKLLKENSLSKQIIYSLLIIIVMTLSNFVNPVTVIILIILAINIILSNINMNKKIILALIIVLSIVSINAFTSLIGIEDRHTQDNATTILICGASVETNGEHVDGYPKSKAREYMKANNIEFTFENQSLAYKQVLLNEYQYLLLHPIKTIKLLAHKFYIEWSGDFYSVEIAKYYGVFNQYTYYFFLSFGAIIYLMVLSVFVLFNKDKVDYIETSNYKLLLLGVMAVLLITLVLNKYSLYATIFIYFISLSQVDYE